MEKVHDENISFLKELLREKNFEWINEKQPAAVNFFTSGGGTHLYLIESAARKCVARINYYPGKNEWGVKKQEYETLKLIEPLGIAPKAYFFSDSNKIKQDFTIVEYIEGEALGKVLDAHVSGLAADLKKLHSSFKFDRPGDTFPPQDKLPYHCGIFDTFGGGEDKKIEKYQEWEGMGKIISPYNRIKETLGKWFNGLDIFDECREFSLCHADLKKENILATKEGIALIDWECAGSDIPETDIGQLFSGCEFSQKQQERFLRDYYGKMPDKAIMERILAVKQVLDFFRILEDYVILKRKKWDAGHMLADLLEYEKRIPV